MSSLTSFTNCVSLLEGSREVVTSTLGSLRLAFLYSSSAAAPFVAVSTSSSASSLRSSASLFLNSFGIALPSSRHWRILRFFS